MIGDHPLLGVGPRNMLGLYSRYLQTENVRVSHNSFLQMAVDAGLPALLMFLGLILQVVSKCTLGRRFGVVAANRGLCLYGPYRLVRHPIYMGYLFGHIGLCLLNPIPWNLGLFGCMYALQILRILAEERMLGEDSEYQEYKQVVRYRLVPGLF